MSVFIANFGPGNVLWPECLETNTIETFESTDLRPFVEANDRKGYIAHAVANSRSVKGLVVLPQTASGWFSLSGVLSASAEDIWIHREKGELWWTTSKADSASVELGRLPTEADEQVYFIRKPCQAWSSANRNEVRLKWNALHPKAKDFLFTERAFQKLGPDNAEYAMALINGDDLTRWHSIPAWNQKADRAGHGAAVSLDDRRLSVIRMRKTAFDVAADANGQVVERKVKNKEVRFAELELDDYLLDLVYRQKGRCALTRIPMQTDRACQDDALRYSLDRIDSDGHYERGNLQVVCKFVNKWKSDSTDGEFRRLLRIVHEHTEV